MHEALTIQQLLCQGTERKERTSAGSIPCVLQLPGHKNSSTLQPAAAAAAAAGTSDGGDTAEAGLEEDWPLEKVRDLPSSASRDRDCLVPLIAEVTAEGHSVLVFCATRKSCETCADMVAELLPQVAPRGERACSSSSAN